jgi:hypothetical protein
LKEAEHEIGHGMGLNHPRPGGQQPGQSVMNESDVCPNDAPNDACNVHPTDIQPCDNAVLNSVYQPDPPPPTPGGGGGGGGGGCYYYSDYYYEDGHFPNGDQTSCTNTWLVSGWVCNGVFNGWAQMLDEGCNYMQ